LAPAMDDRTRPRRNPETQFRNVGDEILVLHTLLKQYHVLNSVAARIWQLADGEHTVTQIADTLAEEFRHDRDEVHRDVVETLEGLAELQLILAGPRTEIPVSSTGSRSGAET
jgi:hypothetical protein